MPSFFCNDTATTEIYTLSLHDALPIWGSRRGRGGGGRRPGRSAGLGRLHLGPSLQLVHSFGHDDLARGETLRDRSRVALREPDLDRPHFDALVFLHHERERGLRAALDRGVRDEDDTLKRVDEEPRIHELVREERVVGVREDGL